MFYFNQKRGFTLLLATIIASLLLAVGGAMFSIIKKEVILSSLGRDSQFAFYAADTGAECALYWDYRHDVFIVGTTTAMCDGQLLAPIPPVVYDQPVSFQFDLNNQLCTVVTVIKYTPGGANETRIDSRGYNTSCATIATNPRALERAIEIYN